MLAETLDHLRIDLLVFLKDDLIGAIGLATADTRLQLLERGFIDILVLADMEDLVNHHAPLEEVIPVGPCQGLGFLLQLSDAQVQLSDGGPFLCGTIQKKEHQKDGCCQRNENKRQPTRELKLRLKSSLQHSMNRLSTTPAWPTWFSKRQSALWKARRTS